MPETWAAIGISTTVSIALFLYLATKIDGINGRIDKQSADLGARIDAQSARIDAQGARIDAQGARIDARASELVGLMGVLSAHVDAQGADLGAKIDGLSQRFEAHLEEHRAPN